MSNTYKSAEHGTAHRAGAADTRFWSSELSLYSMMAKKYYQSAIAQLIRLVHPRTNMSI
jgi:hypothetical protein